MEFCSVVSERVGIDKYVDCGFKSKVGRYEPLYMRMTRQCRSTLNSSIFSCATVLVLIIMILPNNFHQFSAFLVVLFAFRMIMQQTNSEMLFVVILLFCFFVMLEKLFTLLAVPARVFVRDDGHHYVVGLPLSSLLSILTLESVIRE